jgi:hypothetical protein
VVGAAIEHVDRFGAARGCVNGITFVSQMLLERIAHHGLVINDQDPNVLIFRFCHSSCF